MSAITTLDVGTDGVPSAGTTSPTSWAVAQVVAGQTVQWEDRTSGIFKLYPSVKVSLRRPTRKSDLFKATYQFKVPVDRPVTDAGSNTTHVVAGTITFNLDIIYPTIVTSSERSSAYSKFIQHLLLSQIKFALRDLDLPY